ncbi:MAG: hypothetical protein EWM73_03544 [Nitrospira sp.]|nr:MAG: hypothetical protein EWM73_03544 [Nitrospira sp.]
MVQVVSDRGNQFRDTGETAATDALVGEVSEPSLDQIQPRTRRRNEVQLEPRMSLQPACHAGVFVRSIVVHDQMHIKPGQRVGIDLLEEPNELLVPMPRHAVANDRAIEHAQGREQRGGAVALVVVRHGSAAALLQGEARLGAVEGLDLAFLVDTQDQGFVRGIEVQADDIVELLDKMLVAAQLEGLDQMRLEVVPFPDAADGGLAQPVRLGHAAGTPMGRRGRRGVEGRLDHRAHRPLRDARDTSRARGVLFQSRTAKSQKPLSPQLHRRAGDTQLVGDVLTQAALGGQLDNPCAVHQSHGDAPPVRPGGEGDAFIGGQHNGLGHPTHTHTAYAP